MIILFNEDICDIFFPLLKLIEIKFDLKFFGVFFAVITFLAIILLQVFAHAMSCHLQNLERSLHQNLDESKT